MSTGSGLHRRRHQLALLLRIPRNMRPRIAPLVVAFDQGHPSPVVVRITALGLIQDPRHHRGSVLDELATSHLTLGGRRGTGETS